ncbi:hypothetical protein V5N11_004042 [Cardamine amara subsp. amara]|uniref:DUF1985 domain-containing protein n=1 Tax=Cardamine amara subsp. amara TaxID=228776 RepID=A0ABD1AEC4_CARAN
MSSARKLGIALILIVDGVLVVQHQTHRPIFKYVQMLENVDDFLSFPWGRESYLKTIAGMISGPKVPGKVDDHLHTFILQLQQKTKRINRFPLALQLIAFKNISSILDKIHGATDPQTFLQWSPPRLSRHTTLQLSEVIQVERDPDVRICFLN